ncbi:hypothetical protein GGU11DRAFT_760951 [Lentinula aff. detonsa]|nr:hypothetical protein GGU11DRAFT_760951 [Lentinula aff. detonsa]
MVLPNLGYLQNPLPMPNTRAQAKHQTRSNGLTDAVTLSTMNMPGKRTRKKQTTVAGPSETHTRPPRRTKRTVIKKVNATPAPVSSASRATQQHSPASMEHSPGTIPSPAHPSASSPAQPRSSPLIQHPPTPILSPACPPVASPPPPNSPAPSLPSPSSNPPVSTPEDWEEEDDGLTMAILSNDIRSVHAFVKSYTKSIPANKRDVLRSIRQRFIGELQTLALIPEDGDHWPGPDDIPAALPPLRTYLHGVDEEGYYGIVFYTAYLLRELSANLLPEMCYWYLKRFLEDTLLSFFINRTITEFKVADLFGDDVKEVELVESMLSDEEFSDPAARENALQEQADWFWARFDSFVEDSKGKGKWGDAMTRRILEPIIQMSNRVYQETGFHIGGYIYHSEIGASIWVGTKALQRVKATNGTQMLTQARHIGTKIAHVDAELAALHGHCCVKSNAQQRNRHILPMIFAYNAKRIFEKDSDVNKLQPTTFIDNAWRDKVHIVNWPPGVPFYKQGVTTKKGFVAGVQKVTDFRVPDLAKICDPRIAQIEREVKKEEDSENMPLPYFEMVPWNDEARGNYRAVSIPASDLSSGVPLYEEDEEDEDVSLPTTQPSAAPPVPLATHPIQTLSAALRRRPPPIPILSDQRAQLVRRRDSDVDERVEPSLKKARTL